VFRVEAGKLLGFLLIERGIEPYPEKCAAILAMRNPVSVKEGQLLTGRMAALSRFVSARGDKGHPYFQFLRRNSRFVWTEECEEAFLKLKEYLATPRRVVQATVRHAASITLRCDRTGDQFGPRPRAGPSTETNILCKKSIAEAGGEIPSPREGSAGCRVVG